ncbi:MAG: glycosyltransferase family 4 protein [Parcubacteria group bacterium]|jgi:glycosyltransferase involved in cell wall biosynthesis
MTQNPRKILYVSRPITPPWDEASKNFAYALSREIGTVSPATEIHLITAKQLPELPATVIQERIYKYSQKDFKLSDKIRSLFFQFFHKNTFDITHYFFTPTKSNSWVIKNLLKGRSKTIQTVATLREDLFSDMEMKEMMFGDIITTYSDYAKNKLKALGLVNVHKIYPGIDLTDYQPREKDHTLLESSGFTKDDFIINFTGEYIRLGAMDTVITSFISVAQKIPSARLSLAVRVKNERDAQKKKRVIAKLKENNLLHKVSFHDSGIYKMSDIYNLSDISVFPVSDMRGKFDIPLAVIEAMACGKPVIISDLPILQEFSNDKNSVMIPKNSPKALTTAIIDLYENKEKRETLGKNASAYAHQNFNIQKSAQEYITLYNTL